jgi:nitroreductase
LENPDLLKAIANHRSIRSFSDKQVPDDMLMQLVSTAQTAATSSNVQAYSLIKVNDPAKRQAIAAIAGNQKHVIDAPVFLVFCSDLYRLKQAGEFDGREFNTDYIETFLVSTVDTALIAQNLLVAAELTGLGGVYIGAVRNDMKKIIDLLELPAYTYPLFGMCIGYPDFDKYPDKKPRIPTGSILHQDTYNKEAVQDSVKNYDDMMLAYYKDRDTMNRDVKWSTHILNQFSKPRRTDIRECLEQQKIGLK